MATDIINIEYIQIIWKHQLLYDSKDLSLRILDIQTHFFWKQIEVLKKFNTSLLEHLNYRWNIWPPSLLDAL